MREEMGVGASGCRASSHGAFGLLDLLFFTAGEDKPAQSWHLRGPVRLARRRRGPLRHQRGFVRAEVIGWEALVERAATWARATAAPCGSRAATT